MGDAVITAAGMIDARGWGGSHFPWRTWEETAASGKGEGAAKPSSLTSFRWADLFGQPSRSFARADPLTRIASAAAELLSPAFESADAEGRASIGVYMGTSSGSLEVDGQYWLHLKREGAGSPMLFTYTLPSTALGEIAIRHKLRGPILCLLLTPGENTQVLAEACRAIRLGEAESLVCVYANAVESEARHFLRAIDETGAVTSAAYAVLLESPSAADRRGETPLQELENGVGDIVALCERLCVR